MWKHMISKELLENLKSPNFTKVNSIKTYEFSTLNSTIPNKLESKLFDIIDSCFFKKKESHKLTYVAISHLKNYFVKNHLDYAQKYFEWIQKR